MSDGTWGIDAGLSRRDGHDMPVTASEMTAKLAADMGMDSAELDEECRRYAWHLTEMFACHQRLDRVKGTDYGDEYRRRAAQMILTDGRAHEPDQ